METIICDGCIIQNMIVMNKWWENARWNLNNNREGCFIKLTVRKEFQVSKNNINYFGELWWKIEKGQDTHAKLWVGNVERGQYLTAIRWAY